MKVLLTGNRGYIGAVLALMLLERNHSVVGMDSDLYRSCNFAGELAAVPTIEKDIRDAEVDDVAGFDAIIHLGRIIQRSAWRLSPQSHRGPELQGVGEARPTGQKGRRIPISLCLLV